MKATKKMITTYGFEPQMGGKARGIGFEKELAPTVAATRVGGALIIKSDERTDNIHNRQYDEN